MSNYSLLCDVNKGCGMVELTAVRLSDGQVMGQLLNDTARDVADLIGGPRRSLLSPTANAYTNVTVDFSDNGNSYKMSVTRIEDGLALGSLVGSSASDMHTLLAA